MTLWQAIWTAIFRQRIGRFNAMGPDYDNEAEHGDYRRREDLTVRDCVKPITAERIRAAFKSMRAVTSIGAELVEIGAGWCRIELPYRDDLSQHHGFLHAGIITLIADTAGGLAALSMMPAHKDVLAVEFKINLMNPAAGARFAAVARVLKSGRTLSVTEVDIFAATGTGEKLCARMQQTCIAIDIS
jgi:uncharacterized protein (TIGR00369 family)